MVHAKQIFLLSITLAATTVISAPVPGLYGFADSTFHLEARAKVENDAMYPHKIGVQLHKRSGNRKGKQGKATSAVPREPDSVFINSKYKRTRQAVKDATNALASKAQALRVEAQALHDKVTKNNLVPLPSNQHTVASTSVNAVGAAKMEAEALATELEEAGVKWGLIAQTIEKESETTSKRMGVIDSTLASLTKAITSGPVEEIAGNVERVEQLRKHLHVINEEQERHLEQYASITKQWQEFSSREQKIMAKIQEAEK